MQIEERYSMLIVDSATALFRVDFSGRGQLAGELSQRLRFVVRFEVRFHLTISCAHPIERQQKLAQFLSRLIKISEEFNVACIISNQVRAFYLF